MTAEELRAKTIANMEDLLSYRLVRGERRAILTAWLGYAAVIEASDLETILTLMPAREMTMHEHDDHGACCSYAIRKLAEALEALHAHKCACEGDEAATKCCADSTSLVMQAMELEMGCLKTCCK